MSKILTVDEMVCILSNQDHPDARHFKRMLELIGDGIASALAKHFDIIAGPVSMQQPEVGGLAASFKPKFEGQPWPYAMEYYDQDEEFI